MPLAILAAADYGKTAFELCKPVKLFLQKTDNMWSGFLAMENLVGYSLPVVTDKQSMRLAGSVLESVFVAAYRKAMDQVRKEQE